MGSRRKVTLKKQREKRERPHFTPDDIVLAIKGVEKAGLEVYGVEITPTGAINIWTQPRQAEPDKHISSKRDDTAPVKEQALAHPHEFRYSRRIDCADYYHRHFCSRHGRSLPAVSHWGGPRSNFKNLQQTLENNF